MSHAQGGDSLGIPTPAEVEMMRPGRFERRSSIRYPDHLPLRIWIDGESLTAEEIAFAGEIAERGLGTTTTRDYPVGAHVRIEIEAIMPTRIYLGFEMDSLMVDGPDVSYFADVYGTVRRCMPLDDGTFDTGIEIRSDSAVEHLQVLDLYIQHLQSLFTA